MFWIHSVHIRWYAVPRSPAKRAGLIHQFIGGVGFRFRLREGLHCWREGVGSVVDSHMLKHVRCRLNGILTNPVHAHRVAAIVAHHKSAACNPSGGYVHALSLRFNGGLPGNWDSKYRLWSLHSLFRCAVWISRPRAITIYNVSDGEPFVRTSHSFADR